jgi:hypothetical protein
MKLSNRQKADLESILFFIPADMKNIPITENDITHFLALSERGLGTNSGKFASGSGTSALIQGKRWREWHMRSYEEAVLEGTLPYFTLLGGYCGKKRGWFLRLLGFEMFKHAPLPRAVVDYMKKSMFGGTATEIIEQTYLSLKTV